MATTPVPSNFDGSPYPHLRGVPLFFHQNDRKGCKRDVLDARVHFLLRGGNHPPPLVGRGLMHKLFIFSSLIHGLVSVAEVCFKMVLIIKVFGCILPELLHSRPKPDTYIISLCHLFIFHLIINYFHKYF